MPDIVLPLNHHRATIGIAPDGSKFAIFRGSSWTVMDLRATYSGYPKYQLVSRLRKMTDVVGWTSGIVVEQADVR